VNSKTPATVWLVILDLCEKSFLACGGLDVSGIPT